MTKTRRQSRRQLCCARPAGGKLQFVDELKIFTVRKAASDVAGVNILRGSASSEVLKGFLLHSGCQDSPDRSGRGKWSCDTHVQIYISGGVFKLSKSSRQPVSTIFPAGDSLQSALPIPKSVCHMDARCRLFRTETRTAASPWLRGVNSRPASPPPPPLLKRTSGVGAHHGATKSCLLCETRSSSCLQISPNPRDPLWSPDSGLLL